ncbi:MAG: phosphoglycerate dehydrogenase, partial [Candidatus Dadabacteria bacterium]
EGANIEAQYLNTNQEIGYLIMDTEPSLSKNIKKELDSIEESIKTRLLFF